MYTHIQLHVKQKQKKTLQQKQYLAFFPLALITVCKPAFTRQFFYLYPPINYLFFLSLYTGRRNQLSRFEGWGLLVLFLKSFWGKSSVCPGECEIEMLYSVFVVKRRPCYGC